MDGAGIGEISDEMIARRAHELTIADGRHEVTPEDFERARIDLYGNAADDSELIAEEDRPGSGVPSTGSGRQTPRLELDDETNFAAQEVEEGIEEADLDTRVKSPHNR